MDEICEIFHSLEDRGYICFIKWDGERSSKKKSIMVNTSNPDEYFRYDGHNMDKALTSLINWLKKNDIAF